MSRSPSPSPSSARGRPRLRDRLGVRSFFRHKSKSPTPSAQSPTPLPAQSAPSAASLTSLEATSPFNTGSSVTPPADTPAISTVVPTHSVAPTITVQDEPIEDSKTKRWNAAMAECQRRMGVDFLGPETANFRSEKDVMDYIRGRENTEPDSESKGRWQKLQRGLVPLARVSKIFCDPIADTISASFPPSKIILAAVGLIISASIATHEEFEQITDALEEIKVHLQVIEMVAGHRGQLLSGTTVDLLVQIIIVLSVIAQMRREKYGGRFLKAMVEIKPLSEAMKDLKQISSHHQEAIIAGTFEMAMNIQASDEMEKIMKWLNFDSVDSSQRMSSLLNDRAEGTGLWLFRSPAFLHFMEGGKKVLSIQGDAGCGKSTIIASATRHLRAYCALRESMHVVLAHFFDAANNSCRGSLDSLLSSFLCQLALNDQCCMDVLAQTRQRSISNGCFTPQEKLNTLVGMLNARVHGFLVIDALDEAQALNNEHAKIFCALKKLCSCTNISILVSTRVPLADEDLKCDVVSIDRMGDNTDIRTALDIGFSGGGRLFGIAKAEMVRNELMMKAGGNMRWLTLVIEQLRGALNDPRRLGRLLEKLPLSLKGLYGDRLAATNEDLIGDTKLLFAWILYSDKPLTTALLSHVLAFNYDARVPTYDPALLSPHPTSQISQLVDSTFISITEGRVRIAHASVREFLIALSPSSPFYTSVDDAVCLMARTSLSYLLAVVKHNHSTKYNDDLLQLWHRCIFNHEGNHYATLEQDIVNVLHQIGAACPPEGILSPALRSAVIRGHKPLVLLLLTNGVDVNMPVHDFHNWSDLRALHLAAEHGHSGVAELLLERGANIAARTRWQNTPLTLAAHNDQEDVVRLLLEKGADIEDCDKDGCTSLHMAARRGHRSTVNFLLARGAHIAVRTKQQKTPLTLAAHNDQEDVVRLLLEKGAEIEDCDKDGCTSLHMAARRGHLGIVTLLLVRGAHIAVRTRWQDTPLTIAARDGEEDVVRLLLEEGADIEDCDKDGYTSLHQAARRGHHSTVSLLLERGAHIAARTKRQDTPLMAAARNSQEVVIRLLLDKGADIEDCDKHGYTSLHYAARRGHRSTVNFLLARGAHIAARTKQQKTPLTLAACGGEEDVVRLLLDKGADIEDCDEDGYTSLHQAAWRGHVSTVSLLLERGANVNAVSNAYLTPLYIAAQFGHIDIIRLLVDHGAALEARDEDGWTPLYLTVYTSKEEAIKLLLSFGSDPRTRADDGTTLLDAVGRSISLRKDSERDARIRELLLRAGCTEETKRVPLENVIQPEGAREGS